MAGRSDKQPKLDTYYEESARYSTEGRKGYELVVLQVNHPAGANVLHLEQVCGLLLAVLLTLFLLDTSLALDRRVHHLLVVIILEGFRERAILCCFRSLAGSCLLNTTVGVDSVWGGGRAAAGGSGLFADLLEMLAVMRCVRRCMRQKGEISLRLIEAWR